MLLILFVKDKINCEILYVINRDVIFNAEIHKVSILVRFEQVLNIFNLIWET